MFNLFKQYKIHLLIDKTTVEYTVKYIYLNTQNNNNVYENRYIYYYLNLLYFHDINTYFKTFYTKYTLCCIVCTEKKNKFPSFSLFFLLHLWAPYCTHRGDKNLKNCVL